MFKNNVLFYNLQHIKSTINTNCPSSFTNRYNNLRQRNLLGLSSSFLDKKDKNNYDKKLKFIKIAQENQGLFKRIVEKKPDINFFQMEKEFLQNQYYKQQHCNFPSVNFFKPKGTIFQKNFKNLQNQRSYSNFHRNYLNNVLYKNNQNKSSNNIKKFPKINKIKKNNNNYSFSKNSSYENSLNSLSFHEIFPNYFSKKVKFFEIGECSVEIILQRLK
jgi:hypothetical protein